MKWISKEKYTDIQTVEYKRTAKIFLYIFKCIKSLISLVTEKLLTAIYRVAYTCSIALRLNLQKLSLNSSHLQDINVIQIKCI